MGRKGEGKGKAREQEEEGVRLAMFLEAPEWSAPSGVGKAVGKSSPPMRRG